MSFAIDATSPGAGEPTAAIATPRYRVAQAAARWPAVLGAIVTLPFLAVALVASAHWPGRAFPGFFLLGDAVVPTVGLYSWTGMARDVPYHAQVVAVDGHPVHDSAEVYAWVERQPIGTEVSYTLRKNGEILLRRVPTMRFGVRDWWLTVGLLALFGALSAGAGVAVAALQPRAPAARAFLVQGVLTGIFALTGSTLYQPALWGMIHPHIVAQAAFPAAFIHLGLVFPVQRRFVLRRPAWLAVPYVVALVLVVWVMRDFYADPPDLLPLRATYVWSAFGIVALIGLTLFSWVENRTPVVRPQLQAVLPGLLLGTLVGLYGFLNTARAGGNFPINLIALTPFVFYLSVGWAIARHDLFGIGRLAKQAAVYATLTASITLAYGAAVALVSAFAPTAALPGSTGFTIVFVMLVAAAFEPVRKRLQRAADRLFSRGSLDYRRTVGDLSTALSSLLDENEILGRVGRTVTEGFGLRSFAVALWQGEDTRVWRWDADARAMVGTPGAAVGRIRARLAAQPAEAWLPRDEASEVAAGVDAERGHEAALDQAAALHAVLVIPLSAGGSLTGAFLVGRPRSGRPFRQAEVDLLETLAAQSAVALSNAHAYHALAAANADLEDKVQARTAALEQSHRTLAETYEALKAAHTQLVHSEKMASLGILVAGVAHEINNPVTFIAGSVDPLREAMADIERLAAAHPDARLPPMVARAQRAVDVIARGAGRTASIVQDLRRFSRHGESRPIPVDVHEGLEVTLRILRSRWADRITIHRDFGRLALIEAAPDELNQVWMNLLANACDAIVAQGNIWIRTTARPESVEVSIRDDGTGIPPDAERRIFDPFFTTKAPGKGTGLGLAISHGIVTRHRGTITVLSRPGWGTELTVTLPAVSPRTPPP